MASWVDLYEGVEEVPDFILDHWADGNALEPSVLRQLLDAAQEQCEAFAPVLAADAPVPARYKIACVYQAREIYRAGLRDEQDVIGVGDYAIRARPLTSAIKQLLRPERRVPVVG